MQDRYAFDVGDFGKFGLLRHLTRSPPRLPGQAVKPPLGVLWYATEVDDASDTGKFLDYLELDNFGMPSAAADLYRTCDPHLYDLFRWHMQEDRTRSMAMLESIVPLPAPTQFHREITGRGVAARDIWFKGAFAAVSECPIVFCDPDNGIASSAIEKAGSVQHVRVQELERLHKDGHGLVVYHHLNRNEPHLSQILYWIDRLRSFGSGATAVRFRRGNGRAFFVIPGDRAPDLVRRLDLLRNSAWVKNGHLEFVEEGAR